MTFPKAPYEVDVDPYDFIKLGVIKEGKSRATHRKDQLSAFDITKIVFG